MKRRINLYFITMMLISLILSTAVSIAWINNRAQHTARETLDSYLKTTIQLTSAFPADPDHFVDDLSRSFSADVRITLIDLSGEVLGESKAEPGALENHLARAEFVQAAKDGYGEAVRVSATTGRKMLYIARSWEGAYLRFSMPVTETRAFTASIAPVLVLDAVVMALLTALFAGRLSRTIMRPYDKMFASLENAIRGGEAVVLEAEYDEMEPIVRYFGELLGRITDYIGQISAKTDEIETIIGSMEEGLIMLDEDMNILLINTQGSRFLDIPKDSWQRNITYLYRDAHFSGALQEAANKRHRVIADIRARGSIYRFYVNPVREGGYVLLVSDVTELVHLERVRSEFAANVSHELKTPLTSISGFAEMMQAGMVKDSDTMVEYSGKILSESRRLVALINDILKLSSLENTTAEETGAVNVADIFRYVGQVLSEQLREGDITLDVDGALTLDANREKIEELAFNLTDNAIKYNRPGGAIRVTLRRDGFTVADTGIGIPAEHQDRIFERFYRVDKARSRKTGGTGLGLSIAKHVVELYGGSISAAGTGEGTTFTVLFPASRVL